MPLPKMTPAIRDVWNGASSKGDEPTEHRCGVCYGPYGRSAIPCRNDLAAQIEVAADKLAALKERAKSLPVPTERKKP